MLRGLWYAAAALIILAAVGIGSVRLLLPFVPRYQQAILAQAQRDLGLPLNCARIDARWTGRYPELVFHRVTLHDPEGSGVILRAREVRLGLDLAALFERRFRPVTLTIVAPVLSLVRDPDGRIHPAGVPPGHHFSLRALLAHLGAFARVRVSAGDLLWWDRLRHAAPVRFSSVRIDLRHTGGMRVLRLDAALPAAFGRALSVAAEWRGSPAAPLQGRGRFYVHGTDLAAARWGAGRRWMGLSADAGRVDLLAWGGWDAGRLVALGGRVSAHDLRLAGRAGVSPVTLHEADARFGFGRGAGGWWLRIEDLILRRSGDGASTGAPADLAIVHDPSPGGGAGPGAVSVRARNLDLGVWTALLRRAALPAPWTQRLDALRPGGTLAQLALRYPLAAASADPGPAAPTPAAGTAAARPAPRLPAALALRARFAGLSFRPWGRLPGAAGLDGRVDLAGGAVRLALDSRGARLDLPRMFAAPVALTRLSAAATLRRRAGVGWVLRTSELAFANPDLAARARVLLEFPQRGAPIADLQVDIERGRVAAVRRYLPLHGVPARGRAWIEQALTGGRIVSGRVLLRGPLAHFPYDAAQGVFAARFDVRDVPLKYAPDWPRLEAVDGQVAFRGRALTVNVTGGKIYGVAVTGAQAHIPRLGHDEELDVELHAQGPAGDLLRVLRASPVGARHAALLGALDLTGNAALDFDLRLPLADARDETYTGSVAFSGATLTGADWGLHVTALDGALGFDRNGFAADRLTARVGGTPVTVAVATPEPQRLSVVTVRGRADAATVAAFVSGTLAQRCSGGTDWSARLAIPWQERDGRPPPVAMTLRSDLRGLALDLPAPFGKPAAVARALEVRLDLPRRPDTLLHLRYGDLVDAAIRRERTGPGPGGWWYAQLSGPVAAGRAWIPEVYPDGPPVVLDLVHLRLPAPAAGRGAAAGAVPDPRTLPALRLDVTKLRLGDDELGRLRLRAVRVADGLTLPELSLASAHLHLKGSGAWLRTGAGVVTRFRGTLESDDTGRLLGEFGFVQALKGGKADVSIDLSWSGPPTAPRLATLSGTLKGKITDGRLLDVNPGAGRIFGLFSLQALPRRLSLDFSDLFKKGFSFDRIAGSFRLRDGEAYTNDLTMTGPAGDIIVTGRTGLVTRDYDQKVTVIPDLGGTLPIAGTLAGGPAVGAALFLAEHLFRGPIRQLTRYRYTVTGPWKDPVVTRVSGGLGGLLPGPEAPPAAKAAGGAKGPPQPAAGPGSSGRP